MTEDKDFKKVVRARAARTGESYAEARRQLAADTAGGHGADTAKVTINRAAPDIRSDDVEASRSFYAGLLGFNVSMEVERFLIFSSPSNPDIQVSINGDFASLPPGFIVDVGTAERVTEIHDEAVAQNMRIVEALDDKPWGIRRFSLLDPSGNRVSVLAHFEPES